MVLRDKKSSLPYLMMMSIILQLARNDTPDTNKFEEEGNCGKSMRINHINITMHMKTDLQVSKINSMSRVTFKMLLWCFYNF